ncbi:MAG: hypothetical protein ACRBK7_21510 [Acidimicrobiales bacterium]
MKPSPTRPALGGPAPSIRLRGSTGDWWQSDDYREQSVVLIFHRHIH